MTDNNFTGTSGDDSISTVGDGDTVIANGGNDYIRTGVGLDEASIDGGEGIDTVFISASSLSGGIGSGNIFSNVEVLQASSRIVYFKADAEVDFSDFETSNVRTFYLLGLANSSEHLVTTQDDDTILFVATNDVISSGGGNDSVSTSGYVSGYSIETGADADIITATGYSATIDAGSGDDQIDLIGSNQEVLKDLTVIGGEGFDTVHIPNLSRIGSGLDFQGVEHLTSGAITVARDAYIDFTQVAQIDLASIALSGGSETIIGAGDVQAVGSNDVVFSKASDDRINISGASENAHIDGGEGIDTVWLNSSSATAGFGSGNVFTNVEVLTYSGIIYFKAGAAVDLSDFEVNNSSSFHLTGLHESAEQLITTQDDDIIRYVGDDDIIISGLGNDSVSTNVQNISRYFIDTGAGADTISATGFDATIVSGSGDDHINLYNPMLDGDRLTNLTVIGGDGIDTVHLESGTRLGSGLDLRGIEHLTGGSIRIATGAYVDLSQVENVSLSYVVLSGSGETVIGARDVQAGDNDVVIGDSGDGFIFTTSGLDSAYIDGGDGIDTVLINALSSANGLGSGNFFSNVEVLRGNNPVIYLKAGASVDLSDFETSEINSIIGGAGSETIIGTQDADSIIGGDGGDHIFIGAGDHIDGGSGSDTLYYDGTLHYLDSGTLRQIDDDSAIATYSNFEHFNNSGKDSISPSSVEGFTLNPPEQVQDHRPIALNDNIVVSSNDPITIDPTANDIDLSGNGLRIDPDAALFASNGSVVLNENGTITYTPETGYLGGDQISYSILDADGNSSTGSIGINVIATGVTCFTSGTRIQTPSGMKLIESLKVGDLVTTMDNGPKPILWIGKRHLNRDELQSNMKLRPVFLPKSITNAERDILVSQQHGMLLGKNGDCLIRAKHMINHFKGVRIAHGKRSITYIHLLFEQHEIIFSEGVASESFYPGPIGLKSLEPATREEIYSIFPELKYGVAHAPKARNFSKISSFNNCSIPTLSMFIEN